MRSDDYDYDIGDDAEQLARVFFGEQYYEADDPAVEGSGIWQDLWGGIKRFFTRQARNVGKAALEEGRKALPKLVGRLPRPLRPIATAVTPLVQTKIGELAERVGGPVIQPRGGGPMALSGKRARAWNPRLPVAKRRVALRGGAIYPTLPTWGAGSRMSYETYGGGMTTMNF